MRTDVYVVHQFAHKVNEFLTLEHRIIGVYAERADAERARQRVDKPDAIVNPYIAITKHRLRGEL